jgi:poly(3-hydroxybutyrate) depolymerase
MEEVHQGCGAERSSTSLLDVGHLTETRNFGSNPGALRMFTHLPKDIPNRCPLLVVLHGCTQSAAGSWGGMVDARRPLRVRSVISRAATV